MIVIMRNTQALRVYLLVPVVLLLLLGFISQPSVPIVGFVSMPHTTGLGPALHHSAFHVRTYRTVPAALAALHLGHIDAVVVPQILHHQAHIVIWKTAANLTQVLAVENWAYHIVLAEYTQRLHQSLPITIKTLATTAGTQSYSAYLLPGLIGMVIMNTSLFFMANLLTRWRATLVLKRLRATTLRPSAIILAIIASQTLVGLLGVGILIAVARLALKVPLILNIPALLLIVGCGMGVFISLGIVVSALARNPDAAAPLANMVSFGLLFVSGVFFPISSLPGHLQSLARILPLTFLVSALRHALFLNRYDWSEIAYLSGWLIVGIVSSSWFFRWE